MYRTIVDVMLIFRNTITQCSTFSCFNTFSGLQVSLMCDAESCNNCNDACKCNSFGLPFLSQPFCPSANARRQHTIERLTQRGNTNTAALRTSHTVVGSMKIVGKKLHVGSEISPASRTCCQRLAAFDDEFQSLPCANRPESAGKSDSRSTVGLHPSMRTANTDKRCNCYDEEESCSCRPANGRPSFVNDHQSICEPCLACQQQEPFHNELHHSDECHGIDGVQPEISYNSAATYSNARIDQNRLLKLLRRFDTIRERARAAREACLFRFEMRQKQRLRLFGLVDSENQQKAASQDVPTNDINPPPPENEGSATAAATLNDIGVSGGGMLGHVKLCDVFDIGSPARSDKSVTTWPPVLDDESTSIEPTDAVISRLMAKFENIRLDGVTARLENQKRFEIRRKQRKYKV